MAVIKCKECGEEKVIIPINDYVYKRINKKNKEICYFCSYSCMRKAEKEHPEKYCRKGVW